MPSPVESRNALTCSWQTPSSLYQRRRSVEDCSLFASATSRISLSADNTEHVRGKGLRVEAHVVAAPVPGVPAAAEQVLHFIGAPLAGSEVDPAGLHVSRVEIDRHQDEAPAFLLRIGEQLIVVCRVEAQVPVGLQRDVLASQLVELLNQGSEAVRPLAIPALD